jgi:hypothetical protein
MIGFWRLKMMKVPEFLRLKTMKTIGFLDLKIIGFEDN